MNEHDYFWCGFDAAIELVLNHLDNSELIAHCSSFAAGDIKDEIIEEVELYKKDG